jgi:hypothetical protein
MENKSTEVSQSSKAVGSNFLPTQLIDKPGDAILLGKAHDPIRSGLEQNYRADRYLQIAWRTIDQIPGEFL